MENGALVAPKNLKREKPSQRSQYPWKQGSARRAQTCLWMQATLEAPLDVLPSSGGPPLAKPQQATTGDLLTSRRPGPTLATVEHCWRAIRICHADAIVEDGGSNSVALLHRPLRPLHELWLVPAARLATR